MAIIKEIIDVNGWDEWVSTRPPVVQELCRILPPDRLYLLKETGKLVSIVSYYEDGTVQVFVSSEYNKNLLFEREVFGIYPNDLEECDLPNEENEN